MVLDIGSNGESNKYHLPSLTERPIKDELNLDGLEQYAFSSLLESDVKGAKVITHTEELLRKKRSKSNKPGEKNHAPTMKVKNGKLILAGKPSTTTAKYHTKSKQNQFSDYYEEKRKPKIF